MLALAWINVSPRKEVELPVQHGLECYIARKLVQHVFEELYPTVELRQAAHRKLIEVLRVANIVEGWGIPEEEIRRTADCILRVVHPDGG